MTHSRFHSVSRAYRSPAHSSPIRLFAVATAVVAVLAICSPQSAWAAPLSVDTSGQTKGATKSSARWSWPVDPPWRIAHGFVAPETKYSAGHRGIDIVAQAGDPVYAAADGIVAFSGTVVDRPVVTIAHGADTKASIEPVTSTLAPGTPVVAGDRIGTVGTGGHCDRSCVHFGVRVRGDYVSPLLYLASVPRAVLLPVLPETS